MNLIELKAEEVHRLVRKHGFGDWVEQCAIESITDIDGDLIYIFDIDAPCWKLRKQFRYKASSRIPGPGTYFAAITTLLFVKQCERCGVRKKLMDKLGWRGIPRLLLMKSFWTGDRIAMSKAAKCSTCGQKRALPAVAT